jgi:hypothetical protein
MLLFPLPLVAESLHPATTTTNKQTNKPTEISNTLLTRILLHSTGKRSDGKPRGWSDGLERLRGEDGGWMAWRRSQKERRRDVVYARTDSKTNRTDPRQIARGEGELGQGSGAHAKLGKTTRFLQLAGFGVHYGGFLICMTWAKREMQETNPQIHPPTYPCLRSLAFCSPDSKYASARVRCGGGR